MNVREFDCVIIGAGIGGLTAAWELLRAGRTVAIVEAKPQVAGVIGTGRVDEFLLESGPNSFTSFPDDIMQLINEVGLGGRVLAKSMREHDRYIWRGGKLRKVPGKALKPWEFGRALLGLLKSMPPPQGDCTIGEYFRPRVGDAVVENMLKPFLAGVYASDADRVSFEATLPKIYEMVTPHKRLIVPVVRRVRQMRARAKEEKQLGKRTGKSLVSFPDGLRELPEALARKINERGGTIRLGADPHLYIGTIRRWRVSSNREHFETDNVIIATEASSAAKVLAPRQPECADALATIPYAPLTVVHVGVRAEQLREKRNGFGFLTVDGQGVRMLGMIWSDKLFENRAPAGHRLLTCFYGGEKDPEVMQWDDARIEAQLREDLKTTMRFKGGDLRLMKITRWERALPVFRVNHMRTVEKITAALPQGVQLLGNYLGEVSVPNRVVAAKRVASRVIVR